MMTYKDQLNICIIANVPFFSVGGRLQRLTEHLKKHHKIYWINPPLAESYDSKAMNKYWNTENVEILQVPSSNNLLVKTWVKEKYALKFVKELWNRGQLDACVVYDGWGTMRVRRYLRRKDIPTIFDYVDKMYLFSKNKIVQFAHKRMIIDAFKTSKVVTCSALKLEEEALKYNKYAVCLPNCAPNIKATEHEPSKNLVVGYVGAFGDWIDFEIMEKTISTLKDVNFVFVGGGSREKYVEELQEKYSNVIKVAPVEYKDVPKIINSFDVCVIPFKINDITDAVSPLKLFEYWSLKKPVVCTNTYELSNLGFPLVIAHNEDDFLVKLKQLCSSEDMRNKLGKAGYERFIKDYTVDEVGRRFADIIISEYQSSMTGDFL